MKKQHQMLVTLLALGALTGAASTDARAYDRRTRQTQQSGGTADAGAGEDVDVGKIKQRYWSRGDDSDLGVVQNRLYSKEGKVEVSGFGGIVNNDPFLTVYNAGATLGYHLTEYVGVDVIGWKDFDNDSGALDILRSFSHSDANENRPSWMIGGELEWSVLYGKLSLLGKAIIHYDLHLRGGAGLTDTENGRYFTPIVGIGQQFYVNTFTTLNVDFRLTPYKEDIVQRIPGQTEAVGSVIDSRVNWTNTITLGISFLI